jgi:hypothetical protein
MCHISITAAAGKSTTLADGNTVLEVGEKRLDTVHRDSATLLDWITWTFLNKSKIGHGGS